MLKTNQIKKIFNYFKANSNDNIQLQNITKRKRQQCKTCLKKNYNTCYEITMHIQKTERAAEHQTKQSLSHPPIPPSKPPLVRPQKCKSFVQRLRGALFPEGNQLSVNWVL